MAKDSASSQLKFKPGMILNQKYELKTFAGKGGMGEVWRAWDHLGARHIALKFITTDKKRLDSEVRRMQEAFRAAGELTHQNICPSYGLELDKKQGLYLAMKWLDGNALNEIVAFNKDRLRKKGLPGKFPRCVVPEILKPVAAALDYSHSRGVVHRDVKPSNVFLEIKKGKLCGVYLIDFGLASLIRNDVEYETSGTLPYMAPEQWKGGKQNGRTDQYSLAVVAYELYAGFLPFYANNPATLRYKVLYDKPEPIKGLSDELNAVIAKGLAKEKEDRYDSCLEFVREIERAAEKIDFEEADRAPIYPPPRKRYVAEKEDAPENDDDFDLVDEIKGPTLGDKASRALAKLKKTVLGDAGKTAAAGFCAAVLVGAICAFVWIILEMIRRFGETQ